MLTCCQMRLPIVLDGWPSLSVWGGHLKFCASYESVQWPQIHDKVDLHILMRNQEGVCKESLVS